MSFMLKNEETRLFIQYNRRDLLKNRIEIFKLKASKWTNLLDHSELKFSNH